MSSPLPRDQLQAAYRTCACSSILKVARLLSKAYDQALAPAGLNIHQFNILVALAMQPEVSLSELAENLAIDRTTLSRNLALLERRALIIMNGASDKRRRQFVLTSQGEKHLGTALPLWQNVQTLIASHLQGNFVKNINETVSSLRGKDTQKSN